MSGLLALLDDAAVTPRYVHGFEASRELPIIWGITKGSLKNKLLYLLPAIQFRTMGIAPLLMLAGQNAVPHAQYFDVSGNREFNLPHNLILIIASYSYSHLVSSVVFGSKTALPEVDVNRSVRRNARFLSCCPLHTNQ